MSSVVVVHVTKYYRIYRDYYYYYYYYYTGQKSLVHVVFCLFTYCFCGLKDLGSINSNWHICPSVYMQSNQCASFIMQQSKEVSQYKLAVCACLCCGRFFSLQLIIPLMLCMLVVFTSPPVCMWVPENSSVKIRVFMNLKVTQVCVCVLCWLYQWHVCPGGTESAPSHKKGATDAVIPQTREGGWLLDNLTFFSHGSKSCT